jgi:hypothetical protein
LAIKRLTEDEMAPWATYNRGKPITPRQLGKRLGEFGIKAKAIHVSHYEKPKGFLRSQFADAWTASFRYRFRGSYEGEVLLKSRRRSLVELCRSERLHWVITRCPARRAVRPQEPRLQTSRRSKLDLTLDAQFKIFGAPGRPARSRECKSLAVKV